MNYPLRGDLPLSYDLDGDGSAEIGQGLMPAPPPFGVGVFASVWSSTNAHGVVQFSQAPLAAGSQVNASVPFALGLPHEGYWGFRFPAADGVHYGWVQLKTPDLQGNPPVWGGVWVARVFYHPKPGEAIRVGDSTVRLRLRAEPSGSDIRLHFNTDASSFAGGLVIEIRPALGTGEWSRVSTLPQGSTATLPIDAEARLYRAVQGP
jgi:hypothetical protein